MEKKQFVILKKKKKFPNLSSLSFEHPTDSAALVALRKIPGIDAILKLMFGMIQEKRSRLFFLSSSVRVNERQFAFVHELYQEACEILDLQTRPELYIAQTPFTNAFAYGIDKPFIVLNSATVDMMDKDELQAVIAHELGHIISGHMLYYSILLTLINLLRMGGLGIPFGNLALYAFIAALFEWFRKAELTCDRAALLVTQNIETCFRLKMKMAGGRHTDDMDIEEFFRQADEYESQGDIIDSIFKILNNWRATHPHAVSRMRELQRWYEGGNYKEIMSGVYLTRDQEKTNDISDTWRNAYRSFRKDIDDSSDSLAKLLSDMVGAGESFVSYGSDLFKSFFQSKNKDE